MFLPYPEINKSREWTCIELVLLIDFIIPQETGFQCGHRINTPATTKNIYQLIGRQKRGSVGGENLEKYKNELNVILTKIKRPILTDYMQDVNFFSSTTIHNSDNTSNFDRSSCQCIFKSGIQILVLISGYKIISLFKIMHGAPTQVFSSLVCCIWICMNLRKVFFRCW